MKRAICAFILVIVIHAAGWAKGPLPTPGFLHVQGRIQNNRATLVETAISGYFHSFNASIPIEKDGSFHADIATQGIQEFYLYLDNLVVSLFSQPGDTLQLNWDATNPAATITAGSPDPDYARGLQLKVILSQKYQGSLVTLMRRLGNEMTAPDSLKYQWINGLYNEEINTALADTMNMPSSIYKTLNDIYYRFAGLLLDADMLDKYSLKTAYPVDSIHQLKMVKPKIKGRFPAVKTLNKEIFLISDNYRLFLYHYITNKIRYTYGNFTFVYSTDTADRSHFTPMLNMYYTILSNMASYPVRDWMITSYIMHGFEFYSFDEAETVYRDFLPKCAVPAYRDTLVNFYNVAKALKKGNPAPGFTLKDTAGREVSLHDLRGKVVYIDFWGVYCGPCIADIKAYGGQLHKKYEGKDVVFLNVCITGGKTDPGWKNKIRELGLDGINVLGPDWSSNPVCQAYNVIGIPHYVLIDQEGNMVSGSGPDPRQLVGPEENEIDKLLKK